MRSRNPVYSLPRGVFPVHINSDHSHVSRHKSNSCMETGLNKQESFSFGVMSNRNIPDLVKARRDLLLPDSRIGAFEPSLYGTITSICYIEYVTKKTKR